MNVIYLDDSAVMVSNSRYFVVARNILGETFSVKKSGGRNKFSLNA
jgi:hypothetical protein